MQKLFRSLIAVGGLMGLAACGDDVSVTEPPPPPLTISGAPVTAVQVGARVQLSASEAVTWASSAANVASVDANGLVTAAAAGTASITATATADVNRKASVTITVTAPAVRSVTVAPQAVTMNPGGTQGFVANVDADPGVATTVTWASSNTAVVTVTAAGVATAVAPGAATITATSTANTGVAGAASVTVRTPTAATVTIDRVTVGSTLTPVNFLAVVGQIDVSVNVDPGDFVLSKVDLLIDGVVCPGCTQSFTEEQSRALSAAAVYGDEVAGAVSNILFSVQTSQFNPTTGAPNWTNKNHTVSARATLTNAGATSTASSNRDMTFANLNTWVASLTYTGTTASATGSSGTSAGLAYRRGGLTVGVLPVIYNEGQSIVATGGVVTFGSNTCDALFIATAGASGGVRNVSLTGTGPYTAAFPQNTSSSVATVNSVANYEFSSAACAGLNGETPILIAVDNQGNNVFGGTPPCTPASLGGPLPVGQFCPEGSQGFVRLDNRAPGAPTFQANPNTRLNGWINGQVAIGNNTGSSGTANNWLVNGTADAGIGGAAVTATSYLRFIRIGDASAGTVAAANAATAASTLTTPAPTIANNSLCAVISARDELGNESSLPGNSTTCTVPPVANNTPVAAQHLRFGVDIAPPTVVYDVSSLLANARLNGGSVGAEFALAMADTGAVGNSGMLATQPAIGSVIRRTAAGTTFPADCVVGTSASSNTVCNQSATGMNALVPVSSTTTVAAQTIAGYYTFNGTARDAAGNSTQVASPRVVVYDATPAAATAPAVPVTITGAFNAASFLNDNLSIRDYYWTAGFGTALIAPTTITLASQPTAVDAFDAPTLSNTNFAINTTINTFLGLQDGTTVPPTAYAANSNPLNAVNLFVRDQTQAAYTAAPGAVVAPTAPAAGVSVTNFTGAFANATNAATICATAAASAGCVVGSPDPGVVTWTATATGATATFNNPFSRIDFYAQNGTDLVLVGSVAGGSASLVDNGVTRIWTWTLAGLQANALFTQLGGISGGAPGAAIVRNVYAFGVSPTGTVALVSSPFAQTINP